MESHLFKLGRWKLLVMKPHNWAFGHLGLDILVTLNTARAECASVYFYRPQTVVNDGMFQLTSPEVRIIPQRSWVAPFINMLWKANSFCKGFFPGIEDFFTQNSIDIRNWIRQCKRVFLREYRMQVKDINGNPGWPKEVKLALKHYMYLPMVSDKSRPMETVKEVVTRSYFRRSLIRKPIEIHFDDKTEKQARDEAQKLGLTADIKIVTLHVRESGFKISGGREEAAFDLARNARIEDYLAAVDYLVSLGYRVVRIGDSTMMPLRWQGVVDLATSPDKTDLLQLWCLMKSEFFLGCDSGPYVVCYLTNTPTLIANVANPIPSFPIRRECFYILKHVIDRETGEALSLKDMLTEDFLVNWRTNLRYKYIDNTAQEVLQAVQEMLLNLKEPSPETPLQKEYRELIYKTACEFRERVSYIRKWGTDDEFIGDGRIAQFFLERHFDRPVAAQKEMLGARP